MPFASDSTPEDPTTGDATAAIPTPAPAGDQPGWRVGSRYRVVDRLGAGGMADVFRAHDELLARDVAVKVFRAQPQAPETQTSANRQLAELHALARLNHPNLITLFDGSITESDGPAYLVMELVDGATLADRIAEGPLPPDEARELGAQIAAALAYVHAEGMVHRDVKPANILLGVDRTDEGGTLRARLSDFGIVRLLGTERMTSVDFTLGTASYLAPEQARGADVGPPADVYSLGLVLIEALAGQRSFDGTPLEAALARLERDPEIPAGLSPAWTSLLVAMTAREPSARPTAAQVAQLLRDDAATTAAVLGDADGATRALRIPGAASAGAVAGALAGAGFAAPLDPSDDDGYDDGFGEEPHRAGRGRTLVWIAAAAVALAVLVLGAVMMLRPSTPAGSKPPTNSPAANTTSSGAARSTSTRTSPGISPTTVESSTPGAGRSASSASSSASTSAAPSSSARATSAAPNPAGSTPAATSSAAPAPSTSGAPTSSAAVTSSATTTASNAAASSPAAAGASGP